MKNKQKIRCYDCEFFNIMNGRCEGAIIVDDHGVTEHEIYDYRKKNCDGYIKRKRS